MGVQLNTFWSLTSPLLSFMEIKMSHVKIQVQTVILVPHFAFYLTSLRSYWAHKSYVVIYFETRKFPWTLFTQLFFTTAVLQSPAIFLIFDCFSLTEKSALQELLRSNHKKLSAWTTFKRVLCRIRTKTAGQTIILMTGGHISFIWMAICIATIFRFLNPTTFVTFWVVALFI